MEISPYMLGLLLFYSVLFGMAAGVLNDIFRISRIFLGVSYRGRGLGKLRAIKLPFGIKISRGQGGKVKKRALSALIFIEDILLFAFCGCGVTVLNYYLNRGQLRLYTITATLAGFAIYYFTAGKLIMLFAEALTFVAEAALRILFHILSRPFVWIFRATRKIFSPLLKKISYAIEKRKNIVYNKGREAVLEPEEREDFSDGI